MNERKKSIDELLSDLGVLEEAPVEVELKESGTPEAQGDPRAFLEEFLGGLLLLLEVQPEGRRAMPAADWARGYGVAPGTRLGQV
jgi:methionyl-tRNA formyltransferase